MRRLITRGLVAASGLAVIVAAGAAAGPRFYDDDPIAREPESRSAAGAKPLDISLFFEYCVQPVRDGQTPAVQPSRRQHQHDRRSAGLELVHQPHRRGADRPRTAGARPQLGSAVPRRRSGSCCARRIAGTNPGFTARDANGRTWFLQFDIPEFPEGGTGAVEIATKLFWALGYNQVQTFITTFDPGSGRDRSEGHGQAARLARGHRSRATISTRVLERAARNADGTYRVSAGRLDSGNDSRAVPIRGHALRRPERPRAARAAPRAARAACLRCVDEPGRLEGRQHARRARRRERPDGREALSAGCGLDIRHGEQSPRMGHGVGALLRSGAEPPPSLSRSASRSARGRRCPTSPYPSIGLFEGDRFDPDAWKPQTPVTPFIDMRADDAFWAARTGHGLHRRTDSRGGTHRAVLAIRRRNATSRTSSSSAATPSAALYLTAVNPIVNPRLDAAGRLTFANAAVDAGFAAAADGVPRRVVAFRQRHRPDKPHRRNPQHDDHHVRARDVPAATGSFVEIDIAAESADHPAWQQPVRTYFRRDGGRLEAGRARTPAGDSCQRPERAVR